MKSETFCFPTKMFISCFLLFGMVRATDDSHPREHCEASPDAAKCEGYFSWNQTLQYCECRPPSPPFLEFVKPTSHTSDGRRLRTGGYVYFDSCYPGQQKRKMKLMRIGIFVDQGFYEKIGHMDDTVKSYISDVIREANKIFENQFAFRIHVAKWYLARHGRSIPGRGESRNKWMDDVPESQDEQHSECKGSGLIKGMWRLQALTIWALQNEVAIGGPYALWHLFTACRAEQMPDTRLAGGVAMGSVCTRLSAVSLTVFDTNHVTNFAHEVGHNLNGYHTWSDIFKGVITRDPDGQGIMSYGDKKWHGVIQFHDEHKGYMCGLIERTINFRACWADEGDGDSGISDKKVREGVDDDDNCPGWANQGHCTNLQYAGTLFRNCAKSCTQPLVATSTTVPTSTRRPTTQAPTTTSVRPTTRRPTRRPATQGATYKNIGQGLCIHKNGGDGEHEWGNHPTDTCQNLCTSNKKCGGYNASKDGKSCRFVLEAPTDLKVGSLSWQNSHCMTKQAPTTTSVRPTPTRPTRRPATQDCTDVWARNCRWRLWDCSYVKNVQENCRRTCGLCGDSATQRSAKNQEGDSGGIDVVAIVAGVCAGTVVLGLAGALFCAFVRKKTGEMPRE